MADTSNPTALELLELHADGLRGLRLIRCHATEVLAMVECLPPELAACEQLLVAAGWNVVGYGMVVWLIESLSSPPSSAEMLRSDEPVAAWLRAANPGNWPPIEWDELLEGRLGPWAMVVEDHRVISICHTPLAMTERTAECGTWTDPAFRSRGHAAAATAHWAALLRPSGRHLYYCHDPDNLSSRGVAQRLGLRLLGYAWGLRYRDDAAAGDVHPLSLALRAGCG